MIHYSRPKLSDLYTLSQNKLLENCTLHPWYMAVSPRVANYHYDSSVQGHKSPLYEPGKPNQSRLYKTPQTRSYSKKVDLSLIWNPQFAG